MKEYNGKKLYKVLRDGESCNGGYHAWSLPTQDANGKWIPGAWHELEPLPNYWNNGIRVCHRGFHLTNEPHEWFNWDRTIYLAEGDGDSDSDGDDDKIAFSRARLLRPAPLPRWYNRGQQFIELLKARQKENLNTPKPPKKHWRVFDSMLAGSEAAKDAAVKAGVELNARWIATEYESKYPRFKNDYEAGWANAFCARVWKIPYRMQESAHAKMYARLHIVGRGTQEARAFSKDLLDVYLRGYYLCGTVGDVLYVSPLN